jgi:hypothetical protein
MKLRNWRITLGLLAGLLLAGCATVPMAPAEADRYAKTFVIRPDKSTVYVYRDERLGTAAKMTVSLDGKVQGASAPKTYFRWEVDPGRHEITSEAENADTLTITTEPGTDYYVWQESKIGVWGARTQLHLVDRDTGRRGVAECQMAQSNVSP